MELELLSFEKTLLYGTLLNSANWATGGRPLCIAFQGTTIFSPSEKEIVRILNLVYFASICYFWSATKYSFMYILVKQENRSPVLLKVKTQHG
jgi:hypothetical protein